jgi:hypothetical protein
MSQVPKMYKSSKEALLALYQLPDDEFFSEEEADDGSDDELAEVEALPAASNSHSPDNSLVGATLSPRDATATEPVQLLSSSSGTSVLRRKHSTTTTLRVVDDETAASNSHSPDNSMMVDDEPNSHSPDNSLVGATLSPRDATATEPVQLLSSSSRTSVLRRKRSTTTTLRVADDETAASNSLGGGSKIKEVGTKRKRFARNKDKDITPDRTEPRVDSDSDVEDRETWRVTENKHFQDLSPTFTKCAKVSDITVGEHSPEIMYFSKVFTDDMIDEIVVQTNLYATQERTVQRNRQRIVVKTLNWKDITHNELKAFFGCMILMGIHILPRTDNYWSSDDALHVSAIADVMTIKRFKKILEVLHLNDNSKAVERGQERYDKLFKVRPLLSQLPINLQTLYQPSSKLAVDESMIPFKGRSSLKQYNPMKPIKRGYKVWCLADSQTGYIMNFEIYTGKATDNTKDILGLGERVVLNLTSIELLKGEKILIAFDNFFTCYTLMTSLLAEGHYACATVRAHRKGLPDMLKQNDNLKRGESKFAIRGTVAATKWQDNKPVSLLSTAHRPTDMTTVQRKNKDGSTIELQCPRVVKVYNEIMGGVDRFDQLRERYAVGRRSIKWWHRIFHWLLDLAIVNSYIAWKVNTCGVVAVGKRDQLSYRLRLARQLIGSFSSRKQQGRPIAFKRQKSGVASVLDEVRKTNVGNHMPVSGDSWKRCRECSTKWHEKRTRVTCSTCQVPLCIDPCFAVFHRK